MSDPEHVLYDLLPQQRQRGGLRDGCHNFIFLKPCTERFKNSFINRRLFQFIEFFTFLGKSAIGLAGFLIILTSVYSFLSKF